MKLTLKVLISKINVHDGFKRNGYHHRRDNSECHFKFNIGKDRFLLQQISNFFYYRKVSMLMYSQAIKKAFNENKRL